MRCSRLTLLFLLLAIPAPCFSWPAKVVSITDGDTIIVLHNGQRKEIRLYGIDCPEKGQSHGQQAKALTSALVAGRDVNVEHQDIDKYKRTVGLVQVDGQNLSELIIQNGYAWVYTKYCKEKFCSDWVRLEGFARQQKKGMWQDSVVIPPWEWRAAQREGKQTVTQTEPPVILIGDKPTVVPEESLLTKIGRGLTPGNSSGGEKTTNKAQISSPGGEGSASKIQYRCDGRTYCSQMTSCDEAKFFLRNCPGAKMDGNNDGVPCERQWCY
jgi:endonuclease YncB( thermonuclease family)